MAMRRFAMMRDPISRQSVTQKTKRRPRQKPKQSHGVTDPLVNPGNSSHRYQTRAKTDPARTYRRMVTLA